MSVAFNLREVRASATIRDSVIRGERNVYILGARARQTMRVNISSSQGQGGALFDVVSPDGVVLETGATTFEQELPASLLAEREVMPVFPST